jgi:hypothetical protein
MYCAGASRHICSGAVGKELYCTCVFLMYITAVLLSSLDCSVVMERASKNQAQAKVK